MNRESLVPKKSIEKLIYLVLGHRVMLDRDLAALYEVETRVLNQAVRRNIQRFPEDFVLSLTRQEIWNISQIVTCSALKGVLTRFRGRSISWPFRAALLVSS